MTRRASPVILLIPSLAGAVFSGYLSLRLYMTNTCAFEEPCPVVSGMPACYMGLALFLALVLVQVETLRGRIAPAHALVGSALLAGTGVVLAIYASATELQAWWLSDTGYALGLPTCVYGALCFALILGLAIMTLGRREDPRLAT